MGSSGSAPDITRGDIRSAFSQVEEPCTPLTTDEIAEELECAKQTATQNLEQLTELDELRTRQLNDATRVWWRSGGSSTAATQEAESAEFSAFVSAVEDYAIFRLDPDGTVVSWNEGAKRIKGYAEDEIVGKHISTFYTDADIDDGVPEANLETAAAEGRVEDESWRVRKDGSRFWADVVITAIRDDDGTLQGFTKVTRDKTEQHEYEQQLREERDLTKQTDAPQPDIVLLDLNLPRKNGDEVLDEIRDDPDLSCLPVIILTSSEAQEDVAKSYELQANAYLTKPVDPAEFIEVVQSVQSFWLSAVRLPSRDQT